MQQNFSSAYYNESAVLVVWNAYSIHADFLQRGDIDYHLMALMFSHLVNSQRGYILLRSSPGDSVSSSPIPILLWHHWSGIWPTADNSSRLNIDKQTISQLTILLRLCELASTRTQIKPPAITKNKQFLKQYAETWHTHREAGPCTTGKQTSACNSK